MTQNIHKFSEDIQPPRKVCMVAILVLLMGGMFKEG
jgi:hypothetical protein